MTALGISRLVGQVAIIIIVVTGAIASGLSILGVPFILWALVPYGALYALARHASSPWTIAGAGTCAITVEIGVRVGVFLFPQSSTDAIALVFSPLWIGLVVMPAGALVGRLFGYAFVRASFLARVFLSATAASIVGLIFVAFARPDLFPTTVKARREALATIGEPRVLLGQDRFKRSIVSDKASWLVVGMFDDTPGDDLAIVDHTGARLIDASTLQSIGFVKFGGEYGRLWHGYSTLARIEDAFVVVQTGRGVSDTEVRSLENQLLWRFRPDPDLAAWALLPADLDEDAEIEFYSSSSNALTRLDRRGAEVWRKPATLSDLVAIAPRSATAPPWLVASRYGVSVEVLNHIGDRIAALDWPGSRIVGVVDWLDIRTVVAGRVAARGLDVAGVTQFDIPIDSPMALLQAVSWKPEPAVSYLAIASGGDRFLGRWRLRVYAYPQTVVYDEVFEKPVRLFVARNADGTSTLFVTAGSTLSVLRSAK